MEMFKDGKYIIGFLVGVILSFVVTGYVQRNQTILDLVEKNDFPDNNQVEENQETQATSTSESEEKLSKTTIDTTVTQVPGTIITQQTGEGLRPEDPHSPELQRLDLILREAGRMVGRLEAGIKEVQAQQTATVSN